VLGRRVAGFSVDVDAAEYAFAPGGGGTATNGRERPRERGASSPVDDLDGKRGSAKRASPFRGARRAFDTAAALRKRRSRLWSHRSPRAAARRCAGSGALTPSRCSIVAGTRGGPMFGDYDGRPDAPRRRRCAELHRARHLQSRSREQGACLELYGASPPRSRVGSGQACLGGPRIGAGRNARASPAYLAGLLAWVDVSPTDVSAARPPRGSSRRGSRTAPSDSRPVRATLLVDWEHGRAGPPSGIYGWFVARPQDDGRYDEAGTGIRVDDAARTSFVSNGL